VIVEKVREDPARLLGLRALAPLDRHVDGERRDPRPDAYPEGGRAGASYFTTALTAEVGGWESWAANYTFMAGD